MNIKACLMHSTDEWQTPTALFAELNKEFNFEIDLASNEENHLCKQYETMQTNIELNKIFEQKNIYCNPPYSQLKRFVKYCYELAFNYKNNVVMLIPARTDTLAFHTYIYKQRNVEIRFIKGRLHFSNKGPAPFPSMIVVFNGR